MSTPASNTDFYYDFHSLDSLRAQSRNDQSKALRAVAKQFESIFMKMMLKSMRDASFGNPLYDSESEKFYQQMYDDQLSSELSEQGSLGLADMMVAQLEGKFSQSHGPRIAPRNKSDVDLTSMPEVISAIEKNARALDAYQQNAKLNNHHKPAKSLHQIESPQEFIETIWNHARATAKRLKVNPEVLVAQAALETGWGKYAIKDENGISSNNLFNIKADDRWNGPKMKKETTEYIEGAPRQENAMFRAYESIEASFNDYAKFLQTNTRYHKALNRVDNPSQFVRELQSAGYATDPNYAEKIENIMRRDEVKAVFQKLRTQKANASVAVSG